MKKVIFTLTAVLLALVVLVGCNSESASAHTHGYVLQGDGTLKCSGCSSVISEPYWAELSSDGRTVTGQPHLINKEFYEFPESTGSSRAVSGRNIVIYTKDNMNLTVNSANDNVTHVGKANKVTVKNNESFHVKAEASHLDIQKGSVFFESATAADTAVKICPDVENTNIKVNVNQGITLQNLYIEISVKFSVDIGGRGTVKEINAEATTGSPSDVKVKISAENSVTVGKVGCDKAEHIDDGSDPVIKEKLHEHTFDTSKWVMIDSEYHGYKCTSCEYKRESDKKRHSWGDVTDKKIKCTVCDGEIDFPLTKDLLENMFNRAKTVYEEVEKAIEGYIKGSINLDNLTFTKNNGIAKYKASQNGKGCLSWPLWDDSTQSYRETTCDVELSGIEGEFKLINNLPTLEFTFKIVKCSVTGDDATAWKSAIGNVEGQSGKLVETPDGYGNYLEVNGRKYDASYEHYSPQYLFYRAVSEAVFTSGTISFSDIVAKVTNSNGDDDQLTVNGSVNINVSPNGGGGTIEALTDCKIENKCIVGGKTCVAVYELSKGLKLEALYNNQRDQISLNGGTAKMSIRYNDTDEVSVGADFSDKGFVFNGKYIAEDIGFSLKIKLNPNTIDYSSKVSFEIEEGSKIDTYDDVSGWFTNQSAYVNGDSAAPSAVVKVIFDFVKNKINNPQG